MSDRDDPPVFIAATLPSPQQWEGKIIWRRDLKCFQVSDGVSWNQVPKTPTGTNNVAMFGNSTLRLGAAPRDVTGTGVNWSPSTKIAVGAQAAPMYFNLLNGMAANKWICSTAGVTSSDLEPDWPHHAPAGTTVQDGTVVWTATTIGAVTPAWAWNWGWWHIGQALSGQRLNEGIICGRSGRQSDEILRYVDRAIEDPRINTIFFADLFVNDFAAGLSLATYSERWDAFVAKADKARAAGKRVMVQTPLPSGNIDSSSAFTGYVAGLGTKAWIWICNKYREFARARSDVVLWEASPVYLDPNPANSAQKHTDGVHQNVSGHYLLGQSLAEVLTANFPPRSIFTVALDDKNHTVNPLNYGAAGTVDATIAGGGTAPNSMTLKALGGTAAACSASAVARTDISGSWARIVYAATAGDKAQMEWTASVAPYFSPGEVVQAFAEVRILANPTLVNFVQILCRFWGATTQWSYNTVFDTSQQDIGQMITADTVFTLKTLPMVAPTGTTAVQLYVPAVNRGASSFTADFGRTVIRRVTQPVSA